MNRLLTKAVLSRTPQTFCRLVAARYATETGTKEHIGQLVKEDKLVVFIKGTPVSPKCGFSNAVIQILKFHGVDKYKSHNVLEDEHLRQGVKEYSNWPTIPQVFMGGEFLGGCDILLDMHKNGELIEELNKIGIRSALLDEPDKKP